MAVRVSSIGVVAAYRPRSLWAIAGLRGAPGEERRAAETLLSYTTLGDTIDHWQGKLGHAVVVGAVETALEGFVVHPAATISGGDPAPLRGIDGSIAGAARPLIGSRPPAHREAPSDRSFAVSTGSAQIACSTEVFA